MSLLFVYSQTAVANLKHVWVVPAMWATEGRKLLRLPEVVLNAGPTIKNVLGCAPRVGCARRPLPSFLLSPVARRVKDWSACADQGVTHIWVALCCGETVIVAIVVLQIIYAPGGKIGSVSLFVVE